eukprot:gene5198-biopygen10166
MAARLVSASSDTMYDSVASWMARMALLWKRRPSFCAPDTSRTRRWKGGALDEQVGALLEVAHLTERHGAGTPAAVGGLHAGRGLRRLLGLLGRDSALGAGGLLRAGHDERRGLEKGLD